MEKIGSKSEVDYFNYTFELVYMKNAIVTVSFGVMNNFFFLIFKHRTASRKGSAFTEYSLLGKKAQG